MEDDMKNHHLEGLVFFTDLTRFHRLVKDATFEQEAAILTQFAEITHEVVAGRDGTLIKYISDSALGYFPDSHVDAGIEALLEMKYRVEHELVIGGKPAGIRIAAHYGSFYVVHYPPFDIPDVLGDAVNIAVRLGEGGQQEHQGKLIVSAQTFRKLAPETRKSFHKYTPPILYLASA
jgi:class 3 adenylate cyclase